MRFIYCPAILAWCCSSVAVPAAETNIRKSIEIVKRVDRRGAGHTDAVEAVQRIQNADADALLPILRGMDDAGALATNWLRGAFESVAERQLRAKRDLPRKELEAFVADTRHGDRARRLAYEWLSRVDRSAPGRLLPGMLDDPSLELRYDAVARFLGKLEEQEAAGSKRNTLALGYRQVLGHARDLEQIRQVSEKLKGFGEVVDLSRHFGFVMQWSLIGPFDNTGDKGFARAYPPEKSIDITAHYEGKSDEVRWQDHTTADPHGVVDLNKAIGKHHAAVAYAAAEFVSPNERPVELRVGCINACKVWLNGDLLLEREIYHTAMEIDQYIGKGALRPGRNWILVKVCQNDQPEDWAQNWQFQLRVCDQRGTAVLSSDRDTAKRAASD